jgi:hypothetical protein
MAPRTAPANPAAQLVSKIKDRSTNPPINAPNTPMATVVGKSVSSFINRVARKPAASPIMMNAITGMSGLLVCSDMGMVCAK